MLIYEDVILVRPRRTKHEEGERREEILRKAGPRQSG